MMVSSCCENMAGVKHEKRTLTEIMKKKIALLRAAKLSLHLDTFVTDLAVASCKRHKAIDSTKWHYSSDSYAWRVERITAIPSENRCHLSKLNRFDGFDAALTTCCLRYLAPPERLASCSVSRSWLTLRARPELWPSLAFRSPRARGPHVVAVNHADDGNEGCEAAPVDERSLARLAATLPLDGVECLALEDSPGKTTGGVSFARGWRNLLASFPERNKVRSLCLKGHVFRTAAFKLVAKKFGSKLTALECHNDSPSLLIELIRHTPRLKTLGVEHLSEATCDTLSQALATASGGQANKLRSLKVLSWAGYSNVDLARSISLDYLCTRLAARFPDLVELDLKKVMVGVEQRHIGSSESPANDNDASSDATLRHVLSRRGSGDAGLAASIAPFANLRSLAFSFRLWIVAPRQRHTVYNIPIGQQAHSLADSLNEQIVASAASALALACPRLATLIVEFESTADASILCPFVAALAKAEDTRRTPPHLASLTLRGLRIRNVATDAEAILAALTGDSCHWPTSLHACKIVFSDLTYLGICIQDNDAVCTWDHYFRSVFGAVSRLLCVLADRQHRHLQAGEARSCYRLSAYQHLHIGAQITDRSAMISNLTNVNWLEKIPRLVS